MKTHESRPITDQDTSPRHSRRLRLVAAASAALAIAGVGAKVTYEIAQHEYAKFESGKFVHELNERNMFADALRAQMDGRSGLKTRDSVVTLKEGVRYRATPASIDDKKLTILPDASGNVEGTIGKGQVATVSMPVEYVDDGNSTWLGFRMVAADKQLEPGTPFINTTDVQMAEAVDTAATQMVWVNLSQLTEQNEGGRLMSEQRITTDGTTPVLTQNAMLINIEGNTPMAYGFMDNAATAALYEQAYAQ